MTDDRAQMIEAALDAALPAADARPRVLSEAMRWAVGTGGKRIRPRICLAAAEAAGGRAADALHAACAIELLHNYTLVHDDLPSMDNDRERRGKPSVWAKFGEAEAILAADALQALAFAEAARVPRNAAAVVAALADKAYGVVAGQVEDIAEGAKDVDYIYLHKTADLFQAAAEMGARAAGASEENVAKLVTYARELGLAFQFEDDLLDGDSPYGEEETRRLVAAHTAAARAALAGLPGDTAYLDALAERLVNRSI